MNWDFYSVRRKVSLEKFLSGTTNLQEGLNLFSAKGLTPPALEVLTNYYTLVESQKVKQEAKVPVVEKPVELPVEKPAPLPVEAEALQNSFAVTDFLPKSSTQVSKKKSLKHDVVKAVQDDFQE